MWFSKFQYMDIRGLTIHKVINSEDKTKLDYKIDENNVCGSRLNITLPSSSAKSCKLEIEYETAPDASALQWLNPKQTAGGKHPYLFSQCQVNFLFLIFEIIWTTSYIYFSML